MEFVNVGMDLAVLGNHWAAVLDPAGKTLAAPFSVPRGKAGLDQAWQRIEQVTPPGMGVRVIMEPTGWGWLPVAVYYTKKGATVLRSSPTETADLRRFYRRHAKSDRIDTRVLARLPLVKPGGIPAVDLPHPRHQALWRFCKQRQKLVDRVVATSKRIRVIVETAVPGLTEVFPKPVGPAARAIYRDYLNPWRACAAGLEAVKQCIAPRLGRREKRTAGILADMVLRLAREAIDIYGDPQGEKTALGLDYDLLQEELRLELDLLEFLEAQIARVEKHIEKLYQELHPQDHLRTIPGVGEHGAPVFLSGIGDPQRFPGPRQFRSYGGMVPRARESGVTQSKGTRLTKAGKALLRRHAYLCAGVARRYDPQIAACYYDQMVNKGKHHAQALCACAGKVMARALKVLQDGRPYQLMDTQGNPISWEEARTLIRQKYRIPAEIRQRRRNRRPHAWGRTSLSWAGNEVSQDGSMRGMDSSTSPLTPTEVDVSR